MKKRKNVRYWLSQARVDSGLTMNEIAKKVGVTPQALYYWEINERTPKPEVAKRVANILHFDWTLFYQK